MAPQPGKKQQEIYLGISVALCVCHTVPNSVQESACCTGDKLLWAGRSPLEWEQGILQLPFVQGVLISSPTRQRSPVEAVKVLCMQRNLLF